MISDRGSAAACNRHYALELACVGERLSDYLQLVVPATPVMVPIALFVGVARGFCLELRASVLLLPQNPRHASEIRTTLRQALGTWACRHELRMAPCVLLLVVELLSTHVVDHCCHVHVTDLLLDTAAIRRHPLLNGLTRPCAFVQFGILQAACGSLGPRGNPATIVEVGVLSDEAEPRIMGDKHLAHVPGGRPLALLRHVHAICHRLALLALQMPLPEAAEQRISRKTTDHIESETDVDFASAVRPSANLPRSCGRKLTAGPTEVGNCAAAPAADATDPREVLRARC
mmetsp:Transcript_59049/g.169564  ORF Transcript_59049/g.169564 Transcript_59049/m.169564 type:complete len:288 (+) Transcript_59049:429-1292(+)